MASPSDNPSLSPENKSSHPDSLYRELFNLANIVKLIIDPDTLQIVEANPAACAFYGYSQEQLNSLSLVDINAQPEPIVRTIVQDVVAGTKTTFETRHRLASGDIRDVEVQAGLLAPDSKKYLYAIVRDITERKQMEITLHRSEWLYRLFAQNMPDSSVILFDTDMRYTLVDGPFLKRFGTIYEGMVGKLPQEALATQDVVNYVVPVMQRALRGESFSYERQMQDYAYEAHVAPLHDDNGQIIGGMVLSHDITKLKRAEAALANSEQRLQSIIATMGEGIISQRQDGTIDNCNPAAERILGLSAAQMMGLDSFDPRWQAIHEDGSPFPGETHPIVITLRTGQPLNNVIMGVHKPDDSLVWVSINTRPLIRPNESQPYAAVATLIDITEQKRLHDVLATSEERLRLITDNVQDLVMQCDAQDRIVYVSPSCFPLFGYEPEAMIGHFAHEFVPPDSLDKITAALQGIIRQRLTYGIIEARMRHADGHTVDIETTGRFLYDRNANYSGGIFLSRDITERKRLESELRATEERFRSTFEYAPIGMALFTLDGYWLDVNPAICQIMGYPYEELLQKTFKELTHPDDLELDVQNIQHLLAGKIDSYRMEKRYFHKQGHLIWGLISVSLVRDKAGIPIYFICQIEDISERKRLESELRAKEEELRLIMDNMQDMITRSDAQDRILYINPASRNLLGREPEELIGHSRREFVPPDQWDKAASARQRIIEQRLKQGVMEGRLHHPNGHDIDIETVAHFMYDTHSNYTGAIYVSRDITERKQMENLLADQQKLQTSLDKEQELSALKTRMMERIAHEFRTPLTTIQVATETLVHYNDRLTPEKREEKSVTVKNQIRRITHMLDEITMVIRGADTLGHLGLVVTDLDDLCHKVAAELSTALKLPDKYVIEVQGKPLASVDPRVIRDSMTHIMRNAARYSEPADPVRVLITQIGECIEVRVIDHGIGIAADELPRIFEPFFRGSNINERGGLGIGLTIARAAIEAHGGTIRAESQPGKGTTFIITLPI